MTEAPTCAECSAPLPGNRPLFCSTLCGNLARQRRRRERHRYQRDLRVLCAALADDVAKDLVASVCDRESYMAALARCAAGLRRPTRAPIRMPLSRGASATGDYVARDAAEAFEESAHGCYARKTPKRTPRYGADDDDDRSFTVRRGAPSTQKPQAKKSEPAASVVDLRQQDYRRRHAEGLLVEVRLFEEPAERVIVRVLDDDCAEHEHDCAEVAL